jgi:hypothetical protein
VAGDELVAWLPVDPRDALIHRQAVRLVAQDEQIAVLAALVAELRGQLEAALMSAFKDSWNSSTPRAAMTYPAAFRSNHACKFRYIPDSWEKFATSCQETPTDPGIMQPCGPGIHQSCASSAVSVYESKCRGKYT